MRRVHAEGQRERRNMRSHSVTHQPTPKGLDNRGRLRWCCRSCRQEAIDSGQLDQWLAEHDIEYDEDDGCYRRI